MNLLFIRFAIVGIIATAIYYNVNAAYVIGYPSAKVYYDRAERFAGESKYPPSKMLNFAVDNITFFSVKPLRLIVIGLIFVVVSVIAIFYAYIRGIAISGWTSLLVSGWFIGGLLLLAIGIIGEYVGKIYIETKRIPNFL